LRLLLDEMFSHSVAEALRQRGHDAVTVLELVATPGLSDVAVMAMSIDLRRALVTADLNDFRERFSFAAAPAGPGHFGLVLVSGRYSVRSSQSGRLVAALEDLLEAHPTDAGLADREAWI
jgi:predicted nuclease of predicted toxin-antitoxin system